MKNVKCRRGKILINLHVFSLMWCTKGKVQALVGRFLWLSFVRYICRASVRILRTGLTILLSRDFSWWKYAVLACQFHCWLIFLPTQLAASLGVVRESLLVSSPTRYKTTLALILAHLAFILNQLCLLFHFGPYLCFSCRSSRHVGAIALNINIILFLFD